MIIFPAIDILDKKCVRLTQGSYDEVKKYDDDPTSIAKEFTSLGASFIHTVDLNAAKSGSIENLDVIKKMVEVTNAKVQVGGGIRSIEAAKRYFDVGVDRVIVGTAVVNNTPLLEEMSSKFGGKVVISLDVKNEDIYIKGWTESSNVNIFDYLDKVKHIKIDAVVVTDISKDGMMQGPSFELYKKLMDRYDLNFIASGGVSTYDDVKKLQEMNMYGAIIGKAIYEKQIDLKEVL